MAPVKVFIIASALAAWLSAAAPSMAASGDGGTIYGLVSPPSALEVGCQGPCACPIQFTPTYGSFELVRTGFDPLYTYYRVDRYIASPNNGPGYVFITGSGHYKIGGEVALMQELTLDLEIEGRSPQHFDSGLKPVSVPFPQIDIACAVHGFSCYDTVVVVDAAPVDLAAVDTPSRPGIQAVRPNPFARQMTIAFSIDRPGTADLSVVDIGGRRVSVLAAGQFVGSSQVVTWNGRRDDGVAARAGVYWVVLRWSGGTDARRIVKLE